MQIISPMGCIHIIIITVLAMLNVENTIWKWSSEVDAHFHDTRGSHCCLYTLFCTALPLMILCSRTTACSVSSSPAGGHCTVGVGGRGTTFSTRSRNLRGLGGSCPGSKIMVQIFNRILHDHCLLHMLTAQRA